MIARATKGEAYVEFGLGSQRIGHSAKHTQFVITVLPMYFRCRNHRTMPGANQTCAHLHRNLNHTHGRCYNALVLCVCTYFAVLTIWELSECCEYFSDFGGFHVFGGIGFSMSFR